MKPTFLQYDQPLITAMIQCPTADECIEKIGRSLKAGAEALGIQLCQLKKEYRTEETLRRIFAACEGKPIYVTAYRGGQSQGDPDEMNEALLLLAARCGATLCDVYGDMYEDEFPQYQLTQKPEAVRRQQQLIEKLHALGAEVLISSHTQAQLTAEETVRLARLQEERGADVIKIVNKVNGMEEIPGCIEAIQKILGQTHKKLLFLVSQEGRILRYIGPQFGVCMYLCVESHGPLDTPAQPRIQDVLSVREHMRLT